MRYRHEELVLHAVGDLGVRARRALPLEQRRSLFEMGLQLELTAAGAQRDGDGAREDQSAYGPFQDHHVAQRAQHVQRARDGGAELAPREDDQRDVGPVRLVVEGADQELNRRRRQRLLRDQDHAGRVGGARAERLDRRTDLDRDPLLTEEQRRERRVAPGGRQDQDSLASRVHSGDEDAVTPPINIGTPVNMP